ncbi:1-deoxy-D-xylulose-5-phosphate synthase [Thermostilla marina]
MDELLSQIRSPADLAGLDVAALERLAGEMREAMCRLLGRRSAHFASNLGVIELALALHTTFDFRKDRLIWDTGHQIYPHKMLTGRYARFDTMRTKGGLMGYPNPAESEYDLFMTGHAGCSISAAVGLRCGDERMDPDTKRHVVAVIGDGAFPSGIVSEAMNHAGALKRPLIVILNDNMMSICPRVGSIGDYLDRLRMAPFYTGLKHEIQKWLARVPVVGDSVEKMLDQMKHAIKAGMLGGMLFEELGFRYIGPVDGHNIAHLQKYLAMVKKLDTPVLLHVVTKKGHGFPPAEEDPRTFHAPAPFERNGKTEIQFRKKSSVSYTKVARDAVHAAMKNDPRVAVITAAMCQGNMLEPVRDEFPDRYFDVGICESHAVGFAAGLAKAGMRPIVDIYSTFLQRSYDQIFQEVSLQNLPVTFLMDRAGLVGPDGPTHHGVFDLAYMRPFPNLTVMAPGDAEDLARMVPFAVDLGTPAAVRYPKAKAESIARDVAPIELGRAEVLRWGNDGAILCCGAHLRTCLDVADRLEKSGLEIAVINARFVKPLDAETITKAATECRFVVTVEEGVLAGGFGSAVLELLNERQLDTSRVRRVGIPDRYIEHAERAEQLAEVGLDTDGLYAICCQAAGIEPTDLDSVDDIPTSTKSRAS